MGARVVGLEGAQSAQVFGPHSAAAIDLDGNEPARPVEHKVNLCVRGRVPVGAQMLKNQGLPGEAGYLFWCIERSLWPQNVDLDELASRRRQLPAKRKDFLKRAPAHLPAGGAAPGMMHCTRHFQLRII